MKKADLQIGQDYCTSRDRDWPHHSRGKRARVIDLTGWHKHFDSGRGRTEPIECQDGQIHQIPWRFSATTGKGVLVWEYPNNVHQGHYDVLPLSQFKDTWSNGLAREMRASDDWTREHNAAKRRDQTRRSQMDVLNTRVQTLTGKSQAVFDRNGMYLVSREAFEQILEQAEQAESMEWKIREAGERE